MIMAGLVWNGTPEEIIELQSIVSRICVEAKVICNTHGYKRCSAHSLLVDSQRQLDDLLFARRIVERLMQEEWRVSR